MLKKVGHEIDVELLIIRNLKLARLFRKRGSDSDKATSTTWNPLFFPPKSLPEGWRWGVGRFQYCLPVRAQRYLY